MDLEALRDQFAAAALPGIIGRRWEGPDGKVPDDIFEKWAQAAYATADAMLKKRAHSATGDGA